MNTYQKTSFKVAKMEFYVYKGICSKIQRKYCHFRFLHFFVLFCAWKIFQSLWINLYDQDGSFDTHVIVTAQQQPQPQQQNNHNCSWVETK